MKNFNNICCLIYDDFNVNALEITSEHAVMYNLNDNKIVYEKQR